MNIKLLLNRGKFVRNVMGGMLVVVQQDATLSVSSNSSYERLFIKKLGYLEADYKMLHTSAIRDCRGFESRQASCWEIDFCRREVVTSSKGGQNYT